MLCPLRLNWLPTCAAERMGGQRIHTLRMHDVDSIEGAFEQATSAEGMVAGMVRLREEGLIEEVSFGMNANDEHHTVTAGTGGLQETAWSADAIIDLIEAVPPGSFDTALLAYSFNLFSQDGWPVIEACHAAGIRVHVAGIWSGLHHTNAGGTGVRNAALREGQARMEGWAELAQEHGCSLPAVAVAFAALPAAVDKVVMGMKTVAEVEANVAAAAEAGEVPSEIWRQAQARGLLPPHLPLPG